MAALLEVICLTSHLYCELIKQECIVFDKKNSSLCQRFYSVLQKGRIQILKKEQGNREQATGNRFDAVVYENENRYRCFDKFACPKPVASVISFPFIGPELKQLN